MLTNKQKELVDKIGREAVMIDWKVAFGGKSFGNRHLERVNKIAKFLQSKEGGDEFCVLIGAWVHDVSLSFGIDCNPEDIEAHTRRFVGKYSQLLGDDRELVVQCAVSHELGGDNLPIEARIVHDADALDKSGMLGVVRHAWKMTNMEENRLLGTEADLDKLLNHLEKRSEKLFTKTARELVEINNKFRKIFSEDRKFALEILPEISRMAMDGRTSDVISNWLVNNYQHESLSGLELQLSCDYLK